MRRELICIVAFVSSLVGTLAYSDESGRVSTADGGSVFEAFDQTQSAVSSYDVRIKRWSSKFPIDSSKSGQYPSVDKESVCRLIVNHDEKKFFVFSRKITKYAATELNSEEQSIVRNIYLYADGKMTTTRPDRAGARLGSREIPQTAFIDLTQIDYPAFIGRDPLYLNNGIHVIRRLTGQDGPENGLTAEILPDGLFRVRSLVKHDSNCRLESFADPSTFAPKKMSIFERQEEKWNLAYSHEMKYSQRDSFTLPIHGNYTFETKLGNRENRDLQPTDATELGGVELEWLKVNDLSMEFPDWRKVGSSVAEFEKFLDPTQFQSSKGR